MSCPVFDLPAALTPDVGAMLLVLIAVEIACSAYVWDHIQPEVSIGFLSKNGNQFVLGWRESENQFQYQSWPNVGGLPLRFARENLHLAAGRTLRPGFGLGECLDRREIRKLCRSVENGEPPRDPPNELSKFRGG